MNTLHQQRTIQIRLGRILILFALLVLFFVVVSKAQVTTTSITGTIKGLDNLAVTSGKVVFTLTPGSDTTISGTARFVPAPAIVCKIIAGGAVKAFDGASTCTITKNTVLTPKGTAYTMDLCPYNACTAKVVFYATTDTLDISGIVPTPATSPVYNLVDVFSDQSIAGQKTFSDIVTFSNSVNANQIFGSNYTGLYTSNTVNPASTGQIRLAKSDSVQFRNNANSLNLKALSLTAGDYVAIGDSTVSTQVLGSQLFLTHSGGATLGTGGTLGETLTINASQGSASGGAVIIGAGLANSASGGGGNVQLTAGNGGFGGSGGSVILQAGTASSGTPGTITFNSSTTFNQKTGIYNGISLDTGNGPGLVSVPNGVTLTAQAAAITTTNLRTSAAAGLYKACYSLEITQAATTSSAAQLSLGWNNGVAQTFSGTNVTGNTTTSRDSNCVLLRSASSQNITYAVSYSSTGATPMNYAVTIRLEALN